MPRRSTPGRKLGQFNENSAMYLQVSQLVFDLQDEPMKDHDDLPNLRFYLSKVGRPGYMVVNFTALSTAELNALRAFFNEAFERAEPVCRELDKRAEEARERGDGAFYRLYRAVPQLVVRKSKQPQHYQSIPFGPDGVLDVEPGDEFSPQRGVFGKELPQYEQRELVTEDDEAEGERT